MTRHSKKWLATFITAGDPNVNATMKLMSLLQESGSDLIELGIPFSDPMADGPVIQRASERALARGITLRRILALVRKIRGKMDIPILLMGYYNPIFVYGLKNYARDAARAGVDATLVVDLPPEESEELDRELKKVGIDLIYLLTPTSNAERIGLVAKRARGFIYFVSMTGITGGRLQSESNVRKKIKEIRRKTDLPIAIGFGISKADQARRIGKMADGIVVGSALVQMIERKRPISKIKEFVAGLKSVL